MTGGSDGASPVVQDGMSRHRNAGERDGGDTARHGRRRRRAWLAGWTLLVLAVAFAGWSGVSYWQEDHSAALATGRARDDVLRAGQQEIADLNTVNDKQIAAWQQRWLNDTTGTERTLLRGDQASPAMRAMIASTHSSARATVTGAAVTSLDRQAGTAQLIASVLVRVTADDGTSAPLARDRYQAGMTRTAGGWKVSSLLQIPANGS
jgi:Mce-associated membrane protein